VALPAKPPTSQPTNATPDNPMLQSIGRDISNDPTMIGYRPSTQRTSAAPAKPDLVSTNERSLGGRSSPSQEARAIISPYNCELPHGLREFSPCSLGRIEGNQIFHPHPRRRSLSAGSFISFQIPATPISVRLRCKSPTIHAHQAAGNRENSLIGPDVAVEHLTIGFTHKTVVFYP